jgi:anti-sigma28 factor (negative regulator of flagellin synthesis)
VALQKQQKQTVSVPVESGDIINSDDLFISSIEDNTPSYQPLPADIQAKLDAVPDIRIDRVETLKNQIASGSYTISTEMVSKTAEAMINATDLSINIMDTY